MHGVGAKVDATRDLVSCHFHCLLTIKTGPIVKILESQVDRSYPYLVWTQCCSAFPFYLVVFLWLWPQTWCVNFWCQILPIPPGRWGTPQERGKIFWGRWVVATFLMLLSSNLLCKLHMGVNLTSTEVLRRSPQWAFNTHTQKERERS